MLQTIFDIDLYKNINSKGYVLYIVHTNNFKKLLITSVLIIKSLIKWYTLTIKKHTLYNGPPVNGGGILQRSGFLISIPIGIISHIEL